MGVARLGHNLETKPPPNYHHHHNAVIGKAVAVSQGIKDVWSFLWPGQCSCFFLCVETQLGSGLFFVLIHHGHATDLSDIDVL